MALNVTGNININNAAANKAIEETEKKTVAFQEKLKKGIMTAANWGKSFADNATAAGKSFLAFVGPSAAAAAELQQAAAEAGLSAEAYQEMQYALSQGGEVTDEMRLKAHELGLVLKNDAVNAGANLNQALGSVQGAIDGVLSKVATALMPFLQEICDFILDHMPMINSFIERLMPVVTQLFEQLLPPLMSLAEALLPVIMELITMLLPPIAQIIEALLPLIMSIIEPLLPLLQPILELLRPFIDLLLQIVAPLAELLQLILPPLMEVITFLINTALVPLQIAFETVASVLKNVVLGVINEVKNRIETAKLVFSNIIEFIQNIFAGNWKGAWDNIKNIFSGVWDGIKNTVSNVWSTITNVIKDQVNGAIRLINKLVEAVNSIRFKIPEWVPEIGGQTFGLNLKTIPYLAKGGVVSRPTLSVLGESGAEAIVPLERNTGWIKKLAGQITQSDAYEQADTLLPVSYSRAYNGNTAAGNGVEKIVTLLGAFLPQMLNALDITMVMDDRTVAAKLAPKLDEQLGIMLKRKVRC